MSSAEIMPSPMSAFAAPSGESGLYYDPVLRLGMSWLDTPACTALPCDADRAATLAEAVAGIVAIAAAHARNSAELLALRQAVDRALGPPERPRGDAVPDPREAGLAEPPALCDAQKDREAGRLGALKRRQASG